MGLGYDNFDAYIIVNDSKLHELLKEEGNYIIDNSECIKQIIKFSPVRLFKTKFASISVNKKISTTKEEIDGPHTHLLPEIIRHKIKFPIPVDDDMCVQIQVDPFGSVIDGNGNYLDWPGFENDEFQILLKKYGENKYIENKSKIKNIVYDLLKKGDLDSIMKIYKDSNMKELIRLVLAQIVCDKNYDINLRTIGLNTLEKIRAINFRVLRKWAMDRSPEIT